MIPRAELRQLFADLAALPCLWSGDPVPTIRSRIELSVRTLEGQGTDAYTSTFDTPSNAYVYSQVGWRRVMLSAKVVTIALDVPAYDTLDKVRARLRRPSVLARIRAMGLAFAGVKSLTDLDMVADNQSIFAANLDLEFNQVVLDDGAEATAYNRLTASQAVALPAEDGTWIQTINTNNAIPST